jgi:hypothetical protein
MPVGVDSAAKFVRLGDIVGADRDKPAIGNLEFATEFNQPLSLPAVLGAETSAAENENHGMLCLQFVRASGVSRYGRTAHSRGRYLLEQCQPAYE